MKSDKKKERDWSKSDDIENKRYYLLPTSKWSTFFECLHLVVIMYSTFALAIRAGFNLQLEGFLLAMEIIALLENFVYIVVQFRTVQYNHSHKTLNFKFSLKTYWHKGMWADVVGSIPFNLIFRKIILLSMLLIDLIF